MMDNDKIAATNDLEKSHPKLMDSTALHSAFLSNNLVAFCTLLHQGADYTLKNQEGSTTVHLALESITKAASLRPNQTNRLDNPFITAVLEAHVEQRQSTNPCDPNGLSHLQAACITDNVKAVEFFLESGISVNDQINENASDFPGYTALHFAVRYFNFQVVEVLLKHGASTNVKDAEGMTPMHVLLKRNFEMVNVNSDLQSAFPQERNFSGKIAMLLLKSIGNKDTMMIDDLGLSYLHVASAVMDLSVIIKLLKKVTNIDHCVSAESPLWAGYTALHFAVFFDISLVKLLVRRGADLQAKDAKGVTPLDLCLEIYTIEDIHSILFQKEEWKYMKFSDGKTKLLNLIAAMTSYEHFKKFLRKVTKNKVIALANDSPLWPGFTPMHLVVLFAKNIPNKACLEMLSALFEKNEAMIETQDIHGLAPLHLSFRLGKTKDVVDLLMSLHQKLDNSRDLVDEDSLSLLHVACANDNESFANELLSKGSNVNRSYNGEKIEGSIVRGWTPLHLAVVHRKKSQFFPFREEQSSFVRMLLKFGANVNAQDAHGLTPVHLLVHPNNFNFILAYYENSSWRDFVDDVLLSSPDLEEVVAGDSGLSHLHVACSRGREDTVRKLVDKGANVNETIRYLPKMYEDFDRDGYDDEDSIKYVNKTPLYVALNPCLNDKVVDFLLKRGADIFVKNSKGVPLFYEALDNKVVTKALRENQDLQSRAERDIGLTMLHLACSVRDVNLVENLLDNGADVNARINLDSPIWPGYTALHLALQRGSHTGDHDNDLLRLLLERRADVTLPNAKQRTPVHVAYQHYIAQLYYCGVEEPTFEYLSMLLKAHKDFDVNPMSVEGITHFHVACSLADVAVTENFLKFGHVNVDQPLDFSFPNQSSFKSFPGAGCTPLHLAVMKKNSDRKEFVELRSQLETVDWLLKHGASVNAKNALGKTPFHVAIYIELRERLVRGGANVEAKNAYGCTALQSLLSKRPESSATIKELLRCGCRFNTFDSNTEIGSIGLTMRSLPLKEMQELVSMAANDFPDAMKVDEYRRTMIHNLVSIYQIDVSAAEYATLIEQMVQIGYDVDDRDHLGRTPLHIAAKFKNLRAITGLLLAGADINVTDVTGQTPLAHQFQPCTRCVQPIDAEDEQCEHYKVFKLLALQVKKLQIRGLDVHPLNEEVAARAFPGFSRANVSDRFSSELEELKNMRIKSLNYRLTLHDFMSEIKAVAVYPMMSEVEKNAINEFFLSNKEYHQFREKYSEVAGLLRLQYKKAVQRTELIPKAKRSLDYLTGIRVPEVCSRIILRLLKNSELQKANSAADDK